MTYSKKKKKTSNKAKYRITSVFLYNEFELNIELKQKSEGNKKNRKSGEYIANKEKAYYIHEEGYSKYCQGHKTKWNDKHTQ